MLNFALEGLIEAGIRIRNFKLGTSNLRFLPHFTIHHLPFTIYQKGTRSSAG